MNYMIIPPREPQHHEPMRPPMVYVRKLMKWEYKQIVRNLENERPLEETELAALGEDGWEMTGLAQNAPMTYYYFKRPIEE